MEKIKRTQFRWALVGCNFASLSTFRYGSLIQFNHQIPILSLSAPPPLPACHTAGEMDFCRHAAEQWQNRSAGPMLQLCPYQPSQPRSSYPPPTPPLGSTTPLRVAPPRGVSMQVAEVMSSRALVRTSDCEKFGICNQDGLTNKINSFRIADLSFFPWTEVSPEHVCLRVHQWFQDIQHVS